MVVLAEKFVQQGVQGWLDSGGKQRLGRISVFLHGLLRGEGEELLFRLHDLIAELQLIVGIDHRGNCLGSVFLLTGHRADAGLEIGNDFLLHGLVDVLAAAGDGAAAPMMAVGAK